MKYLSGLLVAVFILLSTTMAFASGNKDGAAVVTLFNDPKQVKHYINYINCTNGNRTINCGGIDTTMDNVKINSVFGDIKIADFCTVIFNNKTPERLSFEFLSKELIVKGSFILKDKKSNKIIGNSSNIRTLRFNLNDNKVELEKQTYKRNDIIINMINGATISIDDYKDKDPKYREWDGFKITLTQGKYEYKAIINSPEGVRCYIGLAGKSGY